jgi:hypothetical protein
MSARLSPEAGSLLVKVVEALVAPIQEEKRAQLLEQRLQEEEENVSAGTFSQAIEQDDPNHFYHLIQHTRADALVTLAEHFLATCGEKNEFRGLKGELSWTRGQKCQPNVPPVIPAESWLYTGATTCL